MTEIKTYVYTCFVLPSEFVGKEQAHGLCANPLREVSSPKGPNRFRGLQDADPTAWGMVWRSLGPKPSPIMTKSAFQALQCPILSRLTPDAADPQCAFIVDVVLNVVLRIRGTR